MKKVILYMCMLFMFTGCTKDEKRERTLSENQYYLVAADGEKLLVTLPEEFSSKEQEKEVSVLKAYFQQNATKLLTLYYFKESEEYSADDILKKLKHFSKEYEQLVFFNDGEIVSKTEKKELEAGSMKGYYSEVTYVLDGNESFCAEFYLKKDEYVLNVTLRLDGEDAKHIRIDEIAKDLIQ